MPERQQIRVGDQQRGIRFPRWRAAGHQRATCTRTPASLSSWCKACAPPGFVGLRVQVARHCPGGSVAHRGHRDQQHEQQQWHPRRTARGCGSPGPAAFPPALTGPPPVRLARASAHRDVRGGQPGRVPPGHRSGRRSGSRRRRSAAARPGPAAAGRKSAPPQPHPRSRCTRSRTKSPRSSQPRPNARNLPRRGGVSPAASARRRPRGGRPRSEARCGTPGRSADASCAAVRPARIRTTASTPGRSAAGSTTELPGVGPEAGRTGPGFQLTSRWQPLNNEGSCAW